MIIVECVQGSEEWFTAKLGIPSASSFGKIITSAGKASTSRVKYADQLLANWLAGKHLNCYESADMKRGKELEQQARDNYMFESGNAVEQIGFCYLDEKKETGCSPDGLIGKDGTQEIKCPKASTLVSYYGKLCPVKYYPQVQGQLWITDRQFCDFYAWHPELMPYLIRVERNEEYIGWLKKAVKEFVEYLDTRKEELKGWKV